MRELAPCGTRSAYMRHLRRKEPTCQPCKDAQNAGVKVHVTTESYRARKQGYNMQRYMAEYNLSAEDREISACYRMAIMNDPCFYCGKHQEVMHTDHKHPVAKGGTDHWWNLCRACSKCNRQKGTKTVEEFLAIFSDISGNQSSDTCRRPEQFR